MSGDSTRNGTPPALWAALVIVAVAAGAWVYWRSLPPPEAEGVVRYRTSAKVFCEEGAAACKRMSSLETHGDVKAAKDKVSEAWARVPDAPDGWSEYHLRLSKAKGDLVYLHISQEVYAIRPGAPSARQLREKNLGEADGLRKTFESLREEVATQSK